jgi:hypothetical protein
MGFRDPKLDDRQRAASDAKKALLEKFRAKPGPGHPDFEAREKERLAIAAARAERQAIKDAAAAERARLEAIEREIAAKAAQEELERQELAKLEQAEKDREIEAQKKAERDARYAARKARAGKRRGSRV